MKNKKFKYRHLGRSKAHRRFTTLGLTFSSWFAITVTKDGIIEGFIRRKTWQELETLKLKRPLLKYGLIFRCPRKDNENGLS